MNALYLRVMAGIVAVGLVIALGMAIKINGQKTQEIRDLKADLVAASQALKQASKDIERFSQKEGAIAAEAARLCAAEGDNAFGRGLEMGMAICVARG